MRIVLYVAGVVMMISSIGANLYAVPTVVPEIDGGSLMSGLGLLAGGAMVLKARFGSR